MNLLGERSIFRLVFFDDGFLLFILGVLYAQNAFNTRPCPSHRQRRSLRRVGGGLGDQCNRNRGLQLSSLLHVLFQLASSSSSRKRKDGTLLQVQQCLQSEPGTLRQR